jgi:hypothetical protein
MNDDANPMPRPSDVAMWHRLSGLPDNVTDAGEIVEADAGRRLSAEKASLHTMITALSAAGTPDATRGLARLAASYLLAGDAETAMRYVTRARESLKEANHATD